MVSVKESKVILITGCSSGFGMLSAVRLAASGHKVVATMRNLQKSNRLIELLNEQEAQADIVRLDVTESQSIIKAVSYIKNTYGKIDVLINNAGYGIKGFFEDLSDRDVRGVLETNFFGVLNVTRAVLPLMRERKEGRIINISSISGLYALPSFGAYSASKWALEGFSESLLYEVFPFNIKVALVEPGAYRTEIFYSNAHLAKDFDNPQSPYYQTSQYLREKLKKHLAKSEGNPQEVAELIVKLVTIKNPPFRNLIGGHSQLIYNLRKFLPFKLYAYLLRKIIYA